ncbi:unnamed protein product [Caenorhabditis bovis]|uniref:Polyglutamine-binding protein 1 n=1 Tax=Caenorhabditis bovis TaxID=2654633 RepID=A0A8S1F5C0_9PELO|nr:unnamed protein product [Caenorhabditis bovis]
MSLPPALLARLQKRGIVKLEEEVIAENYESEQATKKFEENASGAPGCPNRYNPYHVCVDFCYDHWGDGTPEYRLPDKYIERKNRMLAKFPLPEGWEEVYDPGVAKFYFWNRTTDEVCWLSPRHPKAYISDPAPRVARENAQGLFGEAEPLSRPSEDRRKSDRGESRWGDRDRDREKNDKRRRRDPEEDEDEDVSEMDDRARLKRAKRKGIDPMDPAAYGDAPVGKWSDGMRAEQVTGADVTAGGPLFQQRPYPAPGAILRKQGKPPRGDDVDPML